MTMETLKKGKRSFSFQRAAHYHINGGILLMAIVLLAMLVANSPWSEAYMNFWNKEVYLQVGDFNLFNHHGHPMVEFDRTQRKIDFPCLKVEEFLVCTQHLDPEDHGIYGYSNGQDGMEQQGFGGRTTLRFGLHGQS